MKLKMLSMIAGGTLILLLITGVGWAMSDQPPLSPNENTASVSSGISYQGQLTNSNGSSLDGSYTMRFVVYDDEVAGSSLWDSGDLDITVDDGLFNVKLVINQEDFNGQALWLSIIIEGETLSPRQEILPAPYALSLRPGANIESEDGIGLSVSSNGIDETDYGLHASANEGFGIYVQSAQNQSVRGEAGNITGFNQPIGPVGVVGIGSSRGVYGSSGNGSGVYGTSDGNYGVWGQSETYRGVTGRTDRLDNDYGLYTPDNLFSLNINLAGAIMQVMQNNGSEPLSPGNVVVFNGINPSVAGVDSPIVQVSRANTANSTAVAGVVYSRFNIDAVNPDLESPDGSAQPSAAAMEVTLAGSASPGEFVLVVVQGPVQVNVSALEDSIQPGDLLSASNIPGQAGKAEKVTINGVETALPGTVFGKALEAASGEQTMIYIYVNLQ